MNNYEKIRGCCLRCNNCNSDRQLEIHHRVFRSEGEIGVENNISLNRKIFNESRGVDLHTWGLHDIENLVVLCSKCHKDKVHGGDYKLREFYKNSFTEPYTFINIPFKKPKKELF